MPESTNPSLTTAAIPFLAALSHHDRILIDSQVEHAVTALLQWAHQFPIVRTERLPGLALLSVTTLRQSTPEPAIVLTKLLLYISAVDDLFDESSTSVEVLTRRCAAWHELARNPSSHVTGEDECGAILCEIRDLLRPHPLFDRLHKPWLAALDAMSEAMRQEHRWRTNYQRAGASALPDFNDYIDNGRRSIACRPVAIAAWILCGEPSVLTGNTALYELEDQVYTCIRLANDLRTDERERTEGNINAVTIREHAGTSQGLPNTHALASARAEIHEQIEAGLARCLQLATHEHSASGTPERFLIDLVHFACGFYDENDFHTFHPTASG